VNEANDIEVDVDNNVDIAQDIDEVTEINSDETHGIEKVLEIIADKAPGVDEETESYGDEAQVVHKEEEIEADEAQDLEEGVGIKFTEAHDIEEEVEINVDGSHDVDKDTNLDVSIIEEKLDNSISLEFGSEWSLCVNEEIVTNAYLNKFMLQYNSKYGFVACKLCGYIIEEYSLYAIMDHVATHVNHLIDIDLRRFTAAVVSLRNTYKPVYALRDVIKVNWRMDPVGGLMINYNAYACLLCPRSKPCYGGKPASMLQHFVKCHPGKLWTEYSEKTSIQARSSTQHFTNKSENTLNSTIFDPSLESFDKESQINAEKEVAKLKRRGKLSSCFKKGSGNFLKVDSKLIHKGKVLFW
jgi:hypothetical protein